MTTNISDLIAQRAAIDAQIAAVQKPQVESARDKLTASAVNTLKAQLTTIRDGLPNGTAREQIGNVVTVLDAVPGILDTEIANMDAQIAAAGGAEAEPGGED